MSRQDWYYIVDRCTEGPVSEENLRQLLRSGKVPPDVVVWDGTDWKVASEAFSFRPSVPPPASPLPVALPAQRTPQAQQPQSQPQVVPPQPPQQPQKASPQPLPPQNVPPPQRPYPAPS